MIRILKNWLEWNWWHSKHMLYVCVIWLVKKYDKKIKTKLIYS